MKDGKKILGLIPARAGSKGIPGKNIKPLCGKPLIAYSIEAAKASRYIDSVVVTTDGSEIADVARAYGARVPFLRPAELASDRAKTIDAVMHAVETLAASGERYDVIVLLQPTQPLRSVEDIDGALDAFFAGDGSGLVSATEVENSPVLIRSIGENGRLRPLLDCSSTVRRQDMPQYYVVNGCIYINRTADVTRELSFNDNPIPYIMPRERSADIDTAADFEWVEYLINRSADR